MKDKIITILDLSTGMVHIKSLPENKDPEQFIADNHFSLSNCDYMVNERGLFNLEISL